MDDKKLENELRQHETTLPEALLPENMKRRLMEMSEEEKKTRSESVPEYSAPAAAAGSTANAAPTENTVNAAPAKKKGIARYVFPVLAAAASLFLAFQLGVNMDAIKDRIAAPAAETASVDEGRKAVKDSGKKSEKEEKEEVEEEKPETGVVEKPETGEDEIKDKEYATYNDMWKDGFIIFTPSEGESYDGWLEYDEYHGSVHYKLSYRYNDNSRLFYCYADDHWFNGKHLWSNETEE